MIREIRERLGWSQNELARRSGVKQGVLSDIESGKTKHPRIDTMVSIADALGVPVDAIIKRGEQVAEDSVLRA